MLISGKIVRISTVFVVLSFLVFGVVANLLNSSSVLAQQGNPNRNPVRICHSTDSHTNPYNNQTVDQDSVDGDLGNDNGQGDHYLNHNGGVWYPGIPDHSWGDIIPPIDGVHNGKNWDANGQGIWNNRCNIPGQEATPTPTPTSTPNPEDPTPTASPTPVSCPQDQHVDASGQRCVNFEFGGPGGSSGTGGQVLGTSTGKVLGTSIMARTGGEDLLSLVFAIGALSSAYGVRKYSYATSKK